MIGRGLMIIGLGALISSLLSACLNNENYLFIFYKHPFYDQLQKYG